MSLRCGCLATGQRNDPRQEQWCQVVGQEKANLVKENFAGEIRHLERQIEGYRRHVQQEADPQMRRELQTTLDEKEHILNRTYINRRLQISKAWTDFDTHYPHKSREGRDAMEKD